MDLAKWLVVGVMLFSATFAIIFALGTEKASALTATSQEDLIELSKTVKSIDDSTLRGKLGENNITFEKQGRDGAPGFTAIFTIYVAENLDCNGEKARISINESAKVATLTAKYKVGPNGCSAAAQIRMNLTEDGAIEGSTNAEDAFQGDSCEASSSGSLGWILCPVIEMGVSFSEFVFNEFVEPFLRDIPVSTKSDDPTYNAWKSFRLIGNIVLVGTMLAVVYAQVKGDR